MMFIAALQSAAANLEGYTNQSPRLPLTDDEHASLLLYLATKPSTHHYITLLHKLECGARIVF